MSLGTEIKVGLFTLVGAGVLTSTAVMLEGTPLLNKNQRFFVKIPNAGGVAERTQVRVSGIQVGEVKSVEILPDGAQLNIEVTPKVKITKGSYIQIKSRGILGDVYIEIQRNQESAEFLPSNTELPLSANADDIQALVTNLNSVTRDVKKVTENLANVLGTKKGEESLQNIVSNIEGITADLRDVTSSQKTNLKEAIQGIRDSAVRIAGLLERNDSKIDKIIANVDEFTTMLKKLSTKDNQGKIENIIDNINETTAGLKRLVAKVEKGEGTIGQLITKDETADEIKKTIKDIQNILKPLTKLQVTVTDRLEYRFANAKPGDRVANEFDVLFSTRPDRFYLLGITNSAYARKVTETTTTTTTNANSTVTNTSENTPENVSKLRFNAQISQRFGPVALRLGLFASSGGFATDIYVLDDKFVGTVEVSQFEGSPTESDNRYGKRGAFNLKMYGNLFVTPNIFFTAGVDGIVLNKKPFPFVGAGFTLTDEDIKGLIAPAISSGGLGK